MLARAFSSTSRLAFRGGIVRPSRPLAVIMSEAAAKPAASGGAAPAVSEAPRWEAMLGSVKGEALRSHLEGVRSDPESSLAVGERPSGTVDYRELVPKGGLSQYDWATLNEVVTSEEGRKTLTTLRASLDEIQEWIKNHDQTVEVVDWEAYHAKLDGVVPGFVSKSKEVLDQALAATPDIDLSAHVQQIDAQSQLVRAAVGEYVASVEEVKQQLQADLAALKTERSITDMTTAEVMALYPELAKEIEKEVAEGNWSV